MKYIILFFIVLAPNIVLAGSSSISQSSFTVNGVPNSVSTERVRITNNDTIEQSYEFSSQLEQDISIIPQEFQLNPGQTQDVVLRFRQPNESNKTQLSLLSFDANQTSPLKVGNGIKLPVEFITSQVAGAAALSETIAPNKPSGSFWHIIIYIIDAILIGSAAYLVNRRKFVKARAGNYKISFV